jgi:hypothetical protein
MYRTLPEGIEFIYSYVYIFITADKSLIKVGYSGDALNFLGRVWAADEYFLFNFEESFCFTFDTKKQAYNAEQTILNSLSFWKAGFDKYFPGHTEYFLGGALNDIFTTMLDQDFDGFVAMRPILDELYIEDYKAPEVTIHVSPVPPKKYQIKIIPW